MLKKLIVLAVSLCIVLVLTISVIFMAHPDPVKDLQNTPFISYDDATINDIMNSICDDVTWKKIESNHSNGYYQINVEGKMKDTPTPFLDGIAGSVIGFDIDVFYNKENVIYDTKIVRIYFDENEFNVDTDIKWAISLLYSAHKYITDGIYQYYPSTN